MGSGGNMRNGTIRHAVLILVLLAKVDPEIETAV